MDVALRLETTGYIDPARWHWRLVDSTGAVLAEHDVRLDTGSPWYEALGDLHGFLRAHAVPDRQRPADGARIARTFGRWIGTEIFGPIGTALARCGAGTVVAIVLPAEAAVIACAGRNAARRGLRHRGPAPQTGPGTTAGHRGRRCDGGPVPAVGATARARPDHGSAGTGAELPERFRGGDRSTDGAGRTGRTRQARRRRLTNTRAEDTVPT